MIAVNTFSEVVMISRQIHLQGRSTVGATSAGLIFFLCAFKQTYRLASFLTFEHPSIQSGLDTWIFPFSVKKQTLSLFGLVSVHVTVSLLDIRYQLSFLF